MLRHELWADLQSAHCHSNIYSAPVKHLPTTGVKIPALITFVWERNTRRLHLNQNDFYFCHQRRWGKKFQPQVQLGDLIWIYTGGIEKKGSPGGWTSVRTGSWRGWCCTTCKVCSSQTCSEMTLLLLWLLSDPPWLVKDEGNAVCCCQVSFLLMWVELGQVKLLQGEEELGELFFWWQGNQLGRAHFLSPTWVFMWATVELWWEQQQHWCWDLGSPANLSLLWGFIVK